MPIFLADSNFLRSDALTEYFDASPSNRIAIAHHVLIEAHKANPQVTITHSFERARQFSSRMLLLREVVDLYSHRLDTGAKIRARIIDNEQGSHFAEWYDDMVRAVEGSAAMRHLLTQQQLSLSMINDFSAQAHEFGEAFREMRKDFTSEELREIRSRILKSRSTQDKLLNKIFEISQDMFRRAEVPGHMRPTYHIDAPHYFLFRYAMCVMIFFIRYVREGNLTTDTNKLVNHTIDLHIAAQATFFHGVLSRDKVVIDVHQQARHLLNIMGAHRFTMRKGSFANV